MIEVASPPVFKWGPYKWPKTTWVTGVMSLLIGVETLSLTGRGLPFTVPQMISPKSSLVSFSHQKLLSNTILILCFKLDTLWRGQTNHGTLLIWDLLIEVDGSSVPTGGLGQVAFAVTCWIPIKFATKTIIKDHKKSSSEGTKWQEPPPHYKWKPTMLSFKKNKLESKHFFFKK